MRGNYRRISTREVAKRLLKYINWGVFFSDSGPPLDPKKYTWVRRWMLVPADDGDERDLLDELAQIGDAYRRDELDITVDVKIKED